MEVKKGKPLSFLKINCLIYIVVSYLMGYTLEGYTKRFYKKSLKRMVY